MVGRVSVCVLALVLAAAVVIDAKSVGSLEPAPPTAPGGMRFAQTNTRMRSEAPDWWHYVAPWWSPPDHAPTKEVPDFVEEPMYAHFKNPPKDTMSVYVPYGRDAMSSFVETETNISPRRAAAASMYPPQQQYARAPAPTVALSAAMATVPRFAQVASAQSVPPMMPSFPGVPQFNDASGAFGLPASLQMPMQYTPLMQQYLAAQQPQQQQAYQQPLAPPPAGSPEAMQYFINQKAMESSEDARYAQLEDAEFGAHAKLASAGAPVPRIWRTDRQSTQDLDEEEEFESGANSADEREMARAAEAVEREGGAKHMPSFRQRLSKQHSHEEAEHKERIAEAQRMRALAAHQFDEDADADSDTEAEAAADADAETEEEGSKPGSIVVDPYRFQQIGDEQEHADAEELDADEEDEQEQEHEHEQEHEAEAETHSDADADSEHAEKNAADLEDEQSLFESKAHRGAEANDQGQTEEVIEEIEDATAAAGNADADAMDNAADDAALEREADALEAANEHRAGPFAFN